MVIRGWIGCICTGSGYGLWGHWDRLHCRTTDFWCTGIWIDLEFPIAVMLLRIAGHYFCWKKSGDMLLHNTLRFPEFFRLPSFLELWFTHWKYLHSCQLIWKGWLWSLYHFEAWKAILEIKISKYLMNKVMNFFLSLLSVLQNRIFFYNFVMFIAKTLNSTTSFCHFTH